MRVFFGEAQPEKKRVQISEVTDVATVQGAKEAHNKQILKELLVGTLAG
jgi:hypothetical protein